MKRSDVDMIAILGLGRSGISAAKAARATGAEVIAVDEKSADDPTIDGACEELSRQGIEVKPGWKGDLRETGAKTVVTSPGVPKDHPLLQQALRDGLEVISEIELAYRIAKDPIVAITGTNGKSTTTVMAWLCAKAAGYDAVLCGNIYGSGYEEIPLAEAAVGEGPDSPFPLHEVEGEGSGMGVPPSVNPVTSTPLPPSSSGAGGGGKRALIAEISSFQLEWVRDFRPKAATITNISPDHLNRYRDFEDYKRTKQKIFARMGPDEVAVWHDGNFATEPPAGIKVLAYGHGAKDAWTDGRRIHLKDACLDLDELPFREPHNLLNAMAAGLLIYGLSDGDADPQALLEALEGFRGLAHRMERLGEKGGIELVNNSMCTNPSALIASSKAIAKKQRLLIGGANKGLDFKPVGDYLRETGLIAYVFGPEGSLIAEQLGGIYPVFNSMAEAFAAAVSDARSGEAVMLAPGATSFGEFADFRERGEAFRKLAKEWLGSPN